MVWCARSAPKVTKKPSVEAVPTKAATAGPAEEHDRDVGGQGCGVTDSRYHEL